MPTFKPYELLISWNPDGSWVAHLWQISESGEPVYTGIVRDDTQPSLEDVFRVVLTLPEASTATAEVPSTGWLSKLLSRFRAGR